MTLCTLQTKGHIMHIFFVFVISIMHFSDSASTKIDINIYGKKCMWIVENEPKVKEWCVYEYISYMRIVRQEKEIYSHEKTVREQHSSCIFRSVPSRLHDAHSIYLCIEVSRQQTSLRYTLPYQAVPIPLSVRRGGCQESMRPCLGHVFFRIFS